MVSVRVLSVSAFSPFIRLDPKLTVSSSFYVVLSNQVETAPLTRDFIGDSNQLLV
jgi:hypothetical protein